jgi:alpha-beta hydrolase superfamily lysophospholipase
MALIESLAKEFKRYVEKIPGKVVVVGESMGGLIASHYIEFLGGHNKG